MVIFASGKMLPRCRFIIGEVPGTAFERHCQHGPRQSVPPSWPSGPFEFLYRWKRVLILVENWRGMIHCASVDHSRESPQVLKRACGGRVGIPVGEESSP